MKTPTRNAMREIKFFVTLFSVSILVNGCNSRLDKTNSKFGGSEKASSLSSFNALNSQIFAPKCLRCHSGGAPAGAVDISSYFSIMSKSGLIQPGDPQSSLIYSEVESGSMPPNGPALSAIEVEGLRNWILAGAPNGPVPRPTPTPTPQLPAPTRFSYVEVQKQIFNRSCVRCHSGAQPAGKIDLTSFAMLMSRSKNIVPGSPAKSLVYGEISGGSMPPRGPAVDPVLIAYLSNWIKAGAKNN